MLAERPTLGRQAISDLRQLPAPRSPLDAAVYTFTDQTGRHLPNEQFAEYSFAVTQGGASILINALRDAGRGQWFRVTERNQLPGLLQERQIIRANREEAAAMSGQRMNPLGPLRNAGIMITGGIVGYDSNVLTGGLGANFLGIGGTTEYRRDNISVYLRVVSVLTGEVLVSVTTDKTVYSVSVQGLFAKYVSFNKLLNIEGGVTTNEPRQVAVRLAIEQAVYAAVMDGADRGLWGFADEAAGREALAKYLETRDGEVPAALVNQPVEPQPAPRAEIPSPTQRETAGAG